MNIPLKPKQVQMYNMLMSRRYREFLFYGASRSGKTFCDSIFFDSTVYSVWGELFGIAEDVSEFIGWDVESDSTGGIRSDSEA